MAIIKCKMCGGDLILEPGSTIATCEYCDSTQTVPSADNEKKLTLFARANRLRAACDFDKAAGVYESIVADFPEEAEAYWGLVLCKYGIEYVDDPATGKKIPTCHRSSFDSVMEDSNLDLALENADVAAQRVYRSEAKTIEEIRKGILAVSNQEAPYDIFICYKETDENGDRTLDSVLAQDIYDALSEKGYRVFFSRITLEDKLGVAYEPYIFAALNSAKVMLVVGTNYEYFNAVWVKNEWSRYIKICAADKSKYLIPCYKNLDAYDMPKEFQHLQGVDLGKMGAIQDLLRGMEKYIPRNKETVQQTVVVRQANSGVEALLKRGQMALEDEDWKKADEFFEEVLNQDAECAEAYVGKALAGEQCGNLQKLVTKRLNAVQNAREENLSIQADSKHIAEALKTYPLKGYLEQETIQALYKFNREYPSAVSIREQQRKAVESYWDTHKQLSRAVKFAQGETAEQLKEAKEKLILALDKRVEHAKNQANDRKTALETKYAAHLASADEKAAKLRQEAEDARENDYQDNLAKVNGEITVYAEADQNVSKLTSLTEAKAFFQANQDYRDGAELVNTCQEKIDNLIAEQNRLAGEKAAREAEEAERQRLEKERLARERAAQIKKWSIISGIAIAAVIAVMLLITKVILPPQNYKKAQQLLDSGDTVAAAMAFGKLDNYKDSQQRSMDLWSQIVERNTISFGYDSMIAIRNDGSIIAVGDDGEEAQNWENVVSISMGSTMVAGLQPDGTVLTTSDSSASVISGWENVVAIDAKYYRLTALQSDGTVLSTKNDSGISGWKNIIAVASGGSHTVALKADGTVVAAGDNRRGQCDVKGWTDIVAISAGYDHTVGLKSDGTVVATNYLPGGEEYRNQCDVSGWTDIVSVAAGSYYTIGLRADGTVVSTRFSGDNDTIKNAQKVGDWNGVVAICAYRGSMGLRADGTILVAADQYRREEWTDIRVDVSPERLQAAEAGIYNEKMAVYQSAEALLAERRFTEAADVFFSLGDFENSADRAKEAKQLRLLELCQLYTEMELENAIYEMTDSNENVFWLPLGGTYFGYDVTEEEQAQMDALEAAFISRINEDVEIWDGGYTVEEVKEVASSGEVELLSDYLTREMDLWEVPGGFEGYLAEVRESTYQNGLAYVESGNYVEALNCFRKVGNYADAPELLERYKTLGAQAGDVVSYGSYDLDDNAENGEEDMEWVVLARDGNKLLLLSRWVVDQQQYTNDIRKDGNLYKSTTSWNECTLRSWMNGSFYNTAFSGDEQSRIQAATITETYWSDKKDDSYTSEDKVFLLSRSEVDKYMSDGLYSFRYGFKYNGTSSLTWWLRDVHTLYPYYACYVTSSGVHDSEYRTGVDSNNMYVRPAIWIDVTDMPAG